MTWDEANRKSMAHPVYLPGQLHPGDNTRSPPTTRTSRTLPNFSTTYASQRNSSSSFSNHPAITMESHNHFAISYNYSVHPEISHQTAEQTYAPTSDDSFILSSVGFPNSFLRLVEHPNYSMVDPALFHTVSQQPSAPVPTAAEFYTCPRIMEPEVSKELIENAQSVEYQLLQKKVRTPVDDKDVGKELEKTSNLTRIGQVESANASGAGQDEHQTTLDNTSTAVHMSCDSNAASDVDAFGYTDTEQEHPTSDYENRVSPTLTYAVADTYEDEDENADTIIDEAHMNGEAVISNAGDEPNLDFYPMPMPHIPDVDPIHMYDPLHNPAAAYWTTLPDESFVGDVYDLLGMERPTISMYGNPPLPAFDTDPFLPFAPWRVNQLPAFQPEPAHRVLTVAAAYLPALGRLYPDATFLVARHPPSANFTARLKGTALATSVALHFPHLVNPSALMDTPGYHGTGEIDNVSIEADKYIVSLVQRDWPVGGVAFLPNTPSAANFVAAVRDAFDVLPGGQEVFYFLSCDVPLVGGNGDGGNKGVYVCRAYEGRKGPQDGRIIDDWLRTQGARGVSQDEFGKEVLVRMGEAWVEPERWPRRKRGGSNKKGEMEMDAEDEEKDGREE